MKWAVLVLAIGSLFVPSAASADEPDVGAGENEFVAISEQSQNPTLSQSGGAAATDATSSNVTYVLDPVCVRGEGISGDSFYGCAGQQECGNNGQLFLVQALLPDGSTSIVGTTCIEPGDPDAAATAPVLTPGRILEAFRRIPLPEAPLAVQPPGGETLVNFDTILHTQAEPFTETVQLLGRQVTFDISPASFTWTLGNGESMTTTDPGRPWARGVPMDQYVSHRYTEAGPVTLDLTTTWGARWRLGNGPWRDVDGTVTMTSPAQDLQVRTAQPQLVSYD